MAEQANSARFWKKKEIAIHAALWWGVLTLELEFWDEVGVSRDVVDARSVPQVPDPHRVVLTSCRQVVTVRVEAHSQDRLEVALHEHDAAASS